ncbi:MAG: ABC transporter permease, partial [Holophagales bacterium]|nr:ABC transporter permease [Holophagales bacterium]
VILDEQAPRWGLDRTGVCYTDFHYWREGNHSFESMALVKSRSFNLVVDGGEPDGGGAAGEARAERIDGARVTHDLMDVLGIGPQRGRMFDAGEDRDGGAPVALIGHSLWQRLFAGSPDAIGRTLRLDGVAHEVVGILPEGLAYPENAELWLPIGGDAEADYGSYRFQGVARLSPGVGLEQAKEDLDALMVPLTERWPFKTGTSSVVVPLREEFLGDSRSVAWGLQAAVLLVLLVACANAGSLMLARGAGRSREIAVRMALGGDRRRIARQLLAEGLMLAAVGGALGVVLGHQGLRALGAYAAEQLPFWVSFEPNPWALAFCLAVSLGTVLVFGLVPAWQSTGVDVQGALRSSETRTGSSRESRRFLTLLVAAEMALAQALLVGAGLVALSQMRLLEVDPGFASENRLAFQISLPEADYAEIATADAFFDRLRQRLAALPGVRSATVSDHPPLFGHDGYFMEVEGNEIRGTDRDGEAQQPVALARQVTEGYVETLGIELLAGRFVHAVSPGGEPPRELVVNETFARSYWGHTDVVGKRARFRGEDSPWHEVVGLAKDTRHYGLDQPMRPGVYQPWGTLERRTAVAVLHTEVPPLGLMPEVREVVRQLDASLPLYRITTLEQELRSSIVLRRLTSWLFGLFAAVALVLAAGGTYGVLSYIVQQHRRDLGVHLALGATPSRLWREVLARGLTPVILGSMAGMAGALAAAQVISSLLYGVDPREPGVYLAVAALLASIAFAATSLPALRAARLDPMAVLRED